MTTRELPASVEFWTDHAADWDGYWRGRAQPHRQALVAACHRWSPFQSVLEVGCGAGTNLALLAAEFPWLTLEGSDVNAGALAFARAHLPHATFRLAAVLDDLRHRPAQSVDLVLACYVLAYVDETTARHAIREMVRVARRAALVVEPLGIGASAVCRAGRINGGPAFIEWRHDYFAMFREVLDETKRPAHLTLGRIHPPADMCDGLTACVFR